ncbi:energy transducer TonB [Prevotella sp. 10(H)]|uniref:energy transducer TonB n=1 Tax=Prevotella sp. 10(H) TaxID=1158294 RepID=UPI0004A73B10|nr:energy transducer TonB [Prevotella sp. 10(H)]
MKNLANLNSAEWCDIIFEGKNKSYGAFELRQSSTKRHLIAFGIIVLFAAVVSCLPAIISTINAATAKADTGKYDEVVTIMEMDNKVAEPEVIQPTIPEPPKYVAMQKFTPPKIVEDDKATDETMTNMADLTSSKVAIGAFEVEKGSTDADAVRKEFERDVVGDGQGGGAPKEPEVFVSAQFMPQFPGGEAEMYKYIYDNIDYPVVDQEMGIQGRVTIRFVVSPTGEITNLQLLKGISQTCDKEAMRVVKSMPRWIPGKNNGVAVPVYFTIPIVYKLK